jgi:hypothetical protein
MNDPNSPMPLDSPMQADQGRLMGCLRNTYNAQPDDSRVRYEMIAEAVIEAARQNGIRPSLFINMVSVAVEALTQAERG